MAALGGLLLVGTALFLLTRAAVVRRRAGRGDVNVLPVEIAFLVGGDEHAVLVAALELHRAGELRPTSRPDGVRLTRVQVMQLAPEGCTTDGSTTSEQPLAQRIARMLAGEPARPAADKRLLGCPELAQLREHLIDRGLVVDSRMTRIVRLSALWPLVVVGLGVSTIEADVDTRGAWVALAAAAAVTIVAAGLSVPRRTPRARRAVEQAAAHRQEAADKLTRRVANVGFGTDDTELRDAGVDPMVVAAHGPAVLWSADPILAVALGAEAPVETRHDRIHADSTPGLANGISSFGDQSFP